MHILRIYGTASCWLWANRLYVGIVDKRTRLLFKHATTAMTHGSVLMLIEHIYCICIMKRYRVGFGRIVGTLALVHVLIRICRDLTYNPPWHHRNYTFLATTQLQWQWNYASRWSWCWLNKCIAYICNGIVLTLNEQIVRWYWCMFGFESVIVWYTSHDDTIVSQLHTCTVS